MCEGEREGEERNREMAEKERADRETEEGAQYCLVSTLLRMMCFQPSGSADNFQTSRRKQMV